MLPFALSLSAFDLSSFSRNLRFSFLVIAFPLGGFASFLFLTVGGFSSSSVVVGR